MKKKQINKQRVNQKELIKKIALINIKELFNEAIKIFDINKKLANKYLKIALRTRDKSNVCLTKKQKTLFCKKCNSFLVPGKNCFIRTKNKYIMYHCEECGNIRKFGIRAKNVEQK